MNKETWMTADECKMLGIVDEVIETKKVKPAMNASVRELYAVYNKVITKTQIKMNKLTDLLKLSNEASEEAIIEAVNAKDAKIAELEASIETATALHKGDKVIVTGRLQISKYTTKDGEERQSLEINADSVGLVPKYAPEPQVPVSDKSDEEPIEDFPW